MASAHRVLLAARRQPLGGVLSDRLRQPVARPAVRPRLVPDQALGHQRGDAAQDVEGGPVLGATDGFGRLKRAAAGEHRQPAEQRPLVLGKEVVAPGDGCRHRPLAWGRVARPAGQQGQAALQAGQQRCRRQVGHAGRRQLDRQRQPFEPPANLGDGWGVGRRQRKVRLGRLGARDEEEHGSGPGDRLGGVVLRQRQWAGGEDVLPRDAQDLPAGGQHLQLGARGQEGGDE
ncbi:MAG: hypothetical protein AVDCRST_MAG19-2496 [uncultured Thermomicrobiales bacterium]|uniref:Uncharacterized protein n=1 Tax=uncultured Thermomicrobiales bacterium TaxID=1645740 RepID=A0A6J4V9U7_9BACT|nr:MAG: hypothetical protein AVDCRST_MAG19-2496 [uncultured Thermomicrobiales bacterium]